MPLGERRQRTQGLHAPVTLSSPNNHFQPDRDLQAKKVHIFLNKLRLRTALTALQRPFQITLPPQKQQQLFWNMICPEKAVTSHIRTGKRFKSQT